MVSGTYAWLTLVTNSVTVESASGTLDIDYNISNANLGGTLIPSATRSGGVMESVTAKLNTGSVDSSINLYITPTLITGISSAALMWEVDVVNTSGAVINHYSGDFSSAVVDTPIKIVDGYSLSSSLLTFNIYVWLDGSRLNSINSTNRFTATITADSVPITGEF